MAGEQRSRVRAQRLVLRDRADPVTPEMVKAACMRLDVKQWDVLRFRWGLDEDIMKIFDQSPERSTRELGRLLGLRRKDIRLLEVNAMANVSAHLELQAAQR